MQRHLMPVTVLISWVEATFPTCRVFIRETHGKTSGKPYDQLSITREGKTGLRYVPVIRGSIDVDVALNQARALSLSKSCLDDSEMAARIVEVLSPR